jgi:hypothetical protein
MSLNASNSGAEAPKGSKKKLIAIIVSSLLVVGFLGLLGLYCLGRMVQEKKQAERNLADGRANAVDCLDQLDKLEAEQKKNGTFKPETESETELIVPAKSKETADQSGSGSASTDSNYSAADLFNTKELVKPLESKNYPSEVLLQQIQQESLPSSTESSSSATTPTSTDTGANGRNPFQ